MEGEEGLGQGQVGGRVEEQVVAKLQEKVNMKHLEVAVRVSRRWQEGEEQNNFWRPLEEDQEKPVYSV